MTFAVLTETDLQRIHDASQQLLEDTGVHIPHPEVRQRFAAAGATVDEASGLVRIPEALVRSSLASAGKTFTLYGRDTSKRAEFGVGRRNYNSISGEALWLDDDTGARRYASLQDVSTAARVAESLPDLTVAGAMSDPHELTPEYGAAAVFAELVRNTTKPLGLWFHNRFVSRYIVEMMIALRGSEQAATEYPFAYPFLEPISPLRFPFHGIDMLFETARLNLPVPIGPMCQTGMSGPATLAGTLSVENAEILAGVCITQLVRPGMPVCYGGIPHAFDMRTTQMIFCGPEQALMAVAMTQLGKHYGLPVYINVGLTDSKVPDAQAGMEAGITLALGALAGADIFGHLGISGVDQASSLDMLVMQHELIGFVERLMRGFTVDDESLALEVIKAVGPGGSFMDQEHTAVHFRQELWFPKLLDRQFYDAWVVEGKRTLADRCRERKEQVLRDQPSVPLPADADRELECLLAQARAELETQGIAWQQGETVLR